MRLRKHPSGFGKGTVSVARIESRLEQATHRRRQHRVRPHHADEPSVAGMLHARAASFTLTGARQRFQLRNCEDKGPGCGLVHIPGNHSPSVTKQKVLRSRRRLRYLPYAYFQTGSPRSIWFFPIRIPVAAPAAPPITAPATGAPTRRPPTAPAAAPIPAPDSPRSVFVSPHALRARMLHRAKPVFAIDSTISKVLFY